MVAHEPAPEGGAGPQRIGALVEREMDHGAVDEQYGGKPKRGRGEEFRPTAEEHRSDRMHAREAHRSERIEIHMLFLQEAEQDHEHTHTHVPGDKHKTN